jgi:hypothetical protein
MNIVAERDCLAKTCLVRAGGAKVRPVKRRKAVFVMKANYPLYLFALVTAFMTAGCEGSDSSQEGVTATSDMNVVARDARGGGSIPQDAAAIAEDMTPVVDATLDASDAGGTGGSGGSGGGGGQGGAGGSGGEGGAGGVMEMLTPPECGPGVDTCEEACRWLADCALAGACELDATDRPLLVSMCETTCGGSQAYGDIICGQRTCEDTIRFAQNDAQFASICRGDAPPEMADPVVPQCTALNTCLGTCNGNQACIDQCYSNATPEASQRFGDIINCARTNQCINLANQIDNTCLREQCGVELERCFGRQAAPEGDGSCNQLLGCLSECGADDRGCRIDCIDGTGEDSYDLYQQAIDCVTESNCGNDGNCQRMNCGAEIDACLDDGRPLGPDTCSEISACFWRCAGANQADCRQSCFEEGTRESQNAWSDFLQCASDARCRNQAGCEAVCAQEMAECRNAGAVEQDAGVVPVVDAGVEPAVDAGAEPVADAGAEPVADAGAEPVADAGAEPAVDAGPEPAVDAGPGEADAGELLAPDAGPAAAVDAGPPPMAEPPAPPVQ